MFRCEKVKTGSIRPIRKPTLFKLRLTDFMRINKSKE
jgi:hypothetical protein